MKIAIVTETFLPSTDGIVTRLCATIQWLIRNGNEVRIIAPDLGVYEFEGARIVGIPARPFMFYKDKKLAFPNRKVGTALKEFDPDIVHVVNPAWLGVAGIYYGRRCHYPMIASYHTKIPQYADYYHLPFLKPALWWFFRTLHNRADLNLCTSVSVQEELIGQRFRDVHVWKRGVAVSRFGPPHYTESMRERLSGGRSEKTLLLYVGRLAPEKEIDKIKEVLEASPEVCLAIVGDGPHRAVLEKHFEGTATTFIGFLHGEELASAYASSDVFLFPSTTETLGLVILEAMASGLPVVAAQSGPTCEQIEDGVNGLLYQKDVPGSFVETVLKFKDETLRKRIAHQALESGRMLDWDYASEQLFDFYEQVLVERGLALQTQKMG